jgi:hypothetical protein
VNSQPAAAIFVGESRGVCISNTTVADIFSLWAGVNRWFADTVQQPHLLETWIGSSHAIENKQDVVRRRVRDLAGEALHL